MSYTLRCRVCETVAVSDSCERCDGPTDMTYDWATVDATHESIAAGPDSLWRYGQLLPSAAHVDYGAGWTPLVRAARLSDLLGVDLRLKLEGLNPTGSYKDRMATLAASAALDGGLHTLCCSTTGNLGRAVAAAAAASGLESIVLVPHGHEAAIAGARVLGIAGSYDDCRRLELELGGLFPWGFVSGNLHPYAAEGARTVSFEIGEQLDWQLPDAVFCPAASGVLFSKLTQGFIELTHAHLASEPVPRMFAAQALGSSPIASAFADDRGISRVQAATGVTSLAVGDPSHGDLAIGAARATGGAIIALDDDAIATMTELFEDTTGIPADCATGASLGALMHALERGDVAEGSRVVLVVSGAAEAERAIDTADVSRVLPDVTHVLAALGVDS